MHSPATIAFVSVLALAGQASARTPPVDGPVSTAPAGGGSPLSTQQQIDQYLAPSAGDALSRADLAGADRDADRRIHGEVSLAVGSNGYRGGSVIAVIPLGEASTLALSYSRSKGGYGYGYGYGEPGYGYDGLTAPLDPDAACVATRYGYGGYDRPVLTGSSMDTVQRCPSRLRPND